MPSQMGRRGAVRAEDGGLITRDKDSVADHVTSAAALKYSPLLLLLHSLAITGILHFLTLSRVTPLHTCSDSMTPLSSLRVLTVPYTRGLKGYSFPKLLRTFSSLTSLTLPNNSADIIRSVVKLPALEKVKFKSGCKGHWSTDVEQVQVTEEGLSLFAQAAPHLTSIM